MLKDRGENESDECEKELWSECRGKTSAHEESINFIGKLKWERNYK